MNILSFGGGVNSTSLLVLALQNKIKIDVVVFADTKNEMPETYEHLKTVIKPLCEEKRIPFYTISKGNLLEDYRAKNLIPFRAFRSCTDKYKIRPLKRFAKEYSKAKGDDEIQWIIGLIMEKNTEQNDLDSLGAITLFH